MLTRFSGYATCYVVWDLYLLLFELLSQVSSPAAEQDPIGREVPRWQQTAARHLLPLGHVGPARLQHPCPWWWWLSCRDPGRTPSLTGKTAAVPLGHKKSASFTPELLKKPIKNQNLNEKSRPCYCRKKLQCMTQVFPECSRTPTNSVKIADNLFIWFNYEPSLWFWGGVGAQVSDAEKTI